MAYACIDIGSNTTRLLVAEAVDGQLRELLQQRTFTRIGKGRRREDPIHEQKIAELALGTLAGGVRWSASFRIGSGYLADAYLRSDPPSIGELNAVRQHVDGVFEGLEVDTPALGVAVGGSATSLRRLVGAVLEHETLERGIRVLASHAIDEVARRFELEPQRVRLLPAGILILEAASDRLRVPLQIGRGGLREGVVLEMIAAEREAA